MRLNRSVLFSLVVLFFLLTGMASGAARIVSHPFSTSAKKSTHSSYYQHNTQEMQTGIFANNDPANWTDPTGRFSQQAWNATLGNDRVQGGIMAAAGIGTMLGGTALVVVPEPTTLTKIGGAAAIVGGADLVATGWKQMTSGQPTRSLTAQSVSAGLEAAGVNPAHAALAGDVGELLLAAGPLGMMGKAAAVVGRPAVKSLSNAGVKSGSSLDKVADDILNWVGPGSRMSKPTGGSDLILRSADKTRQIRFDLTNPHGYQPHVNVETFKPRNLYPGDRSMIQVSNEHVFPKID